MTPSREGFNLYALQGRLLPILLGWGTGSMACGLVWRFSRRSVIRAMGTQFILWGGVDALIAWFGLRTAHRKGVAYAHGQGDPSGPAREARSFARVVALNIGFDALYLFAGARLLRRNRATPPRPGMALGILLQGGFLLIWDVFLLGQLRGRRA